MCRRALSGSRWLARGARGCVCGGRAAPQEAAKPSASRPWSVRCSPLINAETSQHTSSVECWLGSAITRRSHEAAPPARQAAEPRVGRRARPSAALERACGWPWPAACATACRPDAAGSAAARPSPHHPSLATAILPLVVVLERGSCSSTRRQSSRVASRRVPSRDARDAIQHNFFPGRKRCSHRREIAPEGRVTPCNKPIVRIAPSPFRH